MSAQQTEKQDFQPILVLGGTGKTGRRIAARLQQLNVPTRIGSRSVTPSFDWTNVKTWAPALEGVRAVYISYTPDLAVPGATDAIRAFVNAAARQEVRQLVILSGRGEAEAQACEHIVQESGIPWTVVRASWFNQNFSEGAFVDMVNAGVIALPAGEVPEPFVDADDIANVVVKALTEKGHENQVYEVTGRRLMTFADVARDISDALGKQIKFLSLSHTDFVQSVRDSGAPDTVVWMMDYLFSTVLDGRNSSLCDGVQRALGREPRDFRDFARQAVKSGIWGDAA